MKILVTGGAGYIGSHFVRALLKENHQVIVFDNLSRGHKESIPYGVDFENVDLLDPIKLEIALRKFSIDACVHFAAFAYVGESVSKPDLYYKNNVIGSYNLFTLLNKFGVKKVVFSSTCSVYGNPENIPINENEKTDPINPYAKTKLIIEQLLADYESAFGMKSICLRYFNAAGASMNEEIGESHFPEPHLIPLVLFTALGKRESISIFGDDYPTPDGTCIRDYIHVDNLADAHLRALNYLVKKEKSEIINLGTGYGNSVKEVIRKAEKITGREIKIELVSRRKGDPAILVADNKKALDLLGWKPNLRIEDILSSAWKWHSNPKY
ncbi:MAG: UDP-glucose 4-epimerase GalE [Chlorobiaceae bacterium]|nr:UDP-glucose 4-epimerase GalE [Chlorobiaceae bacterium]